MGWKRSWTVTNALRTRSEGQRTNVTPKQRHCEESGYPNAGLAVFSPLKVAFLILTAPSLAYVWDNVIAKVYMASQEVQLAKWKRAKVALKDTLYHTWGLILAI